MYTLIPKRRVLDLTLSLMLVSKLRRFGIQLKKKKKQNKKRSASLLFKPFNYLYPSPYSFLSRPGPKLSLSHKRLPPLSFSVLTSLPSPPLLATTVFCPLISQILECHSFLCHFRYSQEVLQKISNFDAPPYNAFFEVCLCILFLKWVFCDLK